MWVYLVIQILLAIIVTESITEIVIKSEIFNPVTTLFSKLGSWFKTLFSCGYCFSLWVAVAVVFFTNTSYPLTGNHIADLGLMALVIQRLSNILHNVIDKWTDKYYDTKYVNTIKE